VSLYKSHSLFGSHLSPLLQRVTGGETSPGAALPGHRCAPHPLMYTTSLRSMSALTAREDIESPCCSPKRRGGAQH